MKNLGCLVIFLLTIVSAQGQSAPNLANATELSPSAEAASRASSMPINIFTGLPNVSVPIYSYNSPASGLSMNISLDYFSGGVQVSESAGVVGLSWNLNAGGLISRTVRGIPDDQPQFGYLYAAAIPIDFRSNGDRYYYDSLDTQQDIFQFNFNGHGGKFYIGKNKKIVVTPASKIKILPSFGIGADTLKIISFRIIAEDGIKYDFRNAEKGYSKTTGTGSDSSFFKSGSTTYTYYSAWYLTQIVSAFNTDTIKFTYANAYLSMNYHFPQVAYVRIPDGVRTATYSVGGSNVINNYHKITSIDLPGKTKISFIYSNDFFQIEDQPALSKIKISDTAFRFGYLLDYYTNTKLSLKSVTPYTSRQKKPAFNFQYYDFYPVPGSAGDTLYNKKDYWGFYNGANNGNNLIPQVYGQGPWANRQPSAAALKGALASMVLPDGVGVYYNYELNDHYPYLKSLQGYTLTPGGTQNPVTFSQIFNSKHELRLTLDNSVSRQGSAPITGSGILTINIRSTDGTILYSTTTISLYDLFYLGMKVWSFNLANGSYKIETQLAGGTTITGSFPIQMAWENKLPDNSVQGAFSGGIRLASTNQMLAGLTRDVDPEDPSGYDVRIVTRQEYKYVTTDGKSSGFLGDIPSYAYPYSETVINGGTTTTQYSLISSEPISTMNYAQGSPVGYSRVEVISGTASHNTGKTVYEFSDLKDVNSNYYTSGFPYAPTELRSWGIGLPKKISIYDSLGTLVKKTVNIFGIDTLSQLGTDFKSLKLGNTSTTFNGPAGNPSTPRTRTYVGEEYYPMTGRAYILSSSDTLFQSNGTINSTYQNFVYDTNYNLIKVISDYDKTRGLTIEKRNYYPYNFTVGGAVGKMRDSSIIQSPVAMETWITGDANPRIIEGSVSTFKQLGTGQIVIDSLFQLETNKPIDQSAIGVFNPAKLNRNYSYFQPVNYFSVYDAKGNAVQSTNVKTGVSNASILDYDQQYQTAVVANATIADIAYSSFESGGTGSWTVSSTARDSTAAMTGKKSYNLTSGNISKSGLTSARSYVVTCWVKIGGSLTVNGTPGSTPVASQNGWNLFSFPITGVTVVTVSGGGLIDELRLHPKTASMITFTHEPFVGITSATDANNTITYTEYDGLNRPELIRDKDRNIIKRFQYSDSVMIINTAIKWQFQAKECRYGNSGIVDSIFKDINPFSDSFGQTKKVQQTALDCGCPGVDANQFRVINGICQEGTLGVASSVWNNTTRVWECTYRYCFTDGSQSAVMNVTYNASSCSLTCFVF